MVGLIDMRDMILGFERIGIFIGFVDIISTTGGIIGGGSGSGSGSGSFSGSLVIGRVDQ